MLKMKLLLMIINTTSDMFMKINTYNVKFSYINPKATSLIQVCIYVLNMQFLLMHRTTSLIDNTYQ